MKVILLQDINSLGKSGEVKEVSDGYARNFLLPKKLVQIATPQSIKDIKVKRNEERQKEQADLKRLQKIAQKLKDKKLIILAKEKEGKLFGSITPKDVALAFEKENLEIPEKSIIIKETIKKVGKYDIDVKLGKDIQARVSLEIKGEK